MSDTADASADFRASKPLDLGTGVVCASFDPASAAWQSLGTPHDGRGFVELSALPPFDEALRGDRRATRSHRLAMTLPESAFLVVELDGRRPALRADPSDPVRPRWAGEGSEVEARIGADAATLEQAWTIHATASSCSVLLRLRGRIDRPALAEITEVHPPGPTGASTRLHAGGADARIDCPVLGVSATVGVRGPHVVWSDDSSELVGRLVWPAGSHALAFVLRVSISTPTTSRARARVHATRGRDPLIERALAYVRGCTALRSGPDERSILTDHRILPLSWTRDAYWQALALLAADDDGDRQRVADHLRWLWRRCERPDGRWVRSHHADGRRKDLAYQADQQLYPLLELADYWRLTGSLPEGIDWGTEVVRAWSVAIADADATTGFVPSAENAADDPAMAPYIASSQVLLCYTAERLREMADAGVLALDAPALSATARDVRGAFATHFGAGGPWPYAIDLAGGRVDYHDANDLPIALAPLWGFCRAEDSGWRETMAFAFSEANPAWCEGELPGLGSAHTPGPWSLGEVQAWIRARETGDAAALDRARRRLDAMAFRDGMLPEAIGAGGEPIRHWFAWPGAAMAALLQLEDTGRLEAALGAESGG